MVGRYWTQLDGQFSLESLLLDQTVNELSAGGMAQTLDCLAEGREFDPHRPYQHLTTEESTTSIYNSLFLYLPRT